MTEFLLLWIAAGIWAGAVVIDLSLMRIASAMEEIERKIK